ncbi:MAG: methyl-coenzyme M reductase I operon protein C [Candidatus Methanofastidiosum sp.]|nr:methyl-coenzyme M reductase I operon protein C [Methanofastidiosum sp.]
MIGRNTHMVQCRMGGGMGLGGGLAQRGTFADAGRDIIAIAMSPGRRHITKPICEITYAMREAGIKTSVMVLNAGNGVPPEAPSSGVSVLFGIEEKEVEILHEFKLAIIHLGNIRTHVVYKSKFILDLVPIDAIVACQAPVTFEDFEKIGVKTVNNENGTTKGRVVDIVSGIIRGQSCPQEKLDEIISKVKINVHHDSNSI